MVYIIIKTKKWQVRMRTFLITGGSRGLGAAFSEGLPENGDRVLVISRTRPTWWDRRNSAVEYQWIRSDIGSEDGVKIVSSAIQSVPIDVFIHNAGIWEENGFLDASPTEIRQIVDTNLTSLLVLAAPLRASLSLSKTPRVIIVGSTADLDNNSGDCVAYTASKFGLRGAVHALRNLLRPEAVPVTHLSPGSLATTTPFSAGRDAALKEHQGQRIPVQDLVDLVRCIINLSPASCVKEIHLPCISDKDV
jgi:short-subunit dehydrogenase